MSSPDRALPRRDRGNHRRRVRPIADAAETTDLRAALRYFTIAAPRHTADEEASLFPRLRACGGSATEVLDTLTRLEAEHDEVDRRHAGVDALLERWIADGAPEPAATAELRDHVRALQTIYRAHIAIEDQQVFPAATRLLTPEQLRGVGEEMAVRRGVTRQPGGNVESRSPEQTVLSWSMSRELEDVRRTAVDQRGRLSRVLLKTPEVRVLVVGMAKGSTWPEHTASGRVVVNVALGAIDLKTASGTLRLDAGMGASLDPRERHDVVALEDSAFVLIVAGPA